MSALGWTLDNVCIFLTPGNPGVQGHVLETVPDRGPFPTRPIPPWVSRGVWVHLTH